MSSFCLFLSQRKPHSVFFISGSDCLIMFVRFTLGVEVVCSQHFIHFHCWMLFPCMTVPQPLAFRVRTHRELIAVCEVRQHSRFIFQRWLPSDQDCWKDSSFLLICRDTFVKHLISICGECLRSSTVQQNFLYWWKCSLSVQYIAGTTRCTWLLGLRNAASTTEEINLNLIVTHDLWLLHWIAEL